MMGGSIDSNGSMSNMGECKNDPLFLLTKTYLYVGRVAPAEAYGNVMSGRSNWDMSLP